MGTVPLSAILVIPQTFRPPYMEEELSRGGRKMVLKLMKSYQSSPSETREKNFLTPKGKSRNLGWNTTVLLVVVVVGLSLVQGCGGSNRQLLAAQSVAQMQSSNPKKQFQQHIIIPAHQQTTAPAPQYSQVDYKDYQVGPEDLLSIEIYGQEKLNREIRVNGEGAITLPMVGMVQVAGLTPHQIEKQLMELYDADYLVNPQITVAVKEFRHHQVAVTGAVEKPGSYEIIGPRSLLEVLSMAGGISNTGSPAGDMVNVIRRKDDHDQARTAQVNHLQPFSPKTETLVIDFRRLLSGQSPDLNVMVRNGDVVHVPFAGTAYVLGGVRRAGQIAVKENLTVSQAVALAGGIDPIMGTNNITLIRFDENSQPINITGNLNRILARKEPDVPIKDNDVIMVNISGVKKSLYILRTLLPIPTGGYSLGTM